MFSQEILESLNEYETTIIQYLANNKSITVKKVKEVINKRETFSRKQLKHLENLSLIEWH